MCRAGRDTSAGYRTAFSGMESFLGCLYGHRVLQKTGLASGQPRVFSIAGTLDGLQRIVEAYATLQVSAAGVEVKQHAPSRYQQR